MNIESIKTKLQTSSIYHSEEKILNNNSVIGYEKKFKWSWMATQLNTFIVATDFGDTEIDELLIESHLAESFEFSKKNYKGWPRGLQSGVGVISILISTNISEQAKAYCETLKSGKKWAGFSIPVVHDSQTNTTYQFEKKPMWGRIFYPHFEKLINALK
jgi:hypothetical protein